MSGDYDQWLVALSFVVALLASYTALDLIGRAAFQQGWARRAALAGGAVALGCGVWSMHFIGMIAFRLPIHIAYDLPITLLSLLLALFAALPVALLAVRKRLSWRQAAFGGLLAGAGICAMHYVGMAAMRMSPPIHYDWLWMAQSMAIAVLASMAAIHLGARLSRRDLPHRMLQRIGGALLMAVAIAGMHYTSMEAAHFAPGALCTATSALDDNILLGIGIGLFAFLLMGVALLAPLYSVIAPQSGASAAVVWRRWHLGLLGGVLLVAMIGGSGALLYEIYKVTLSGIENEADIIHQLRTQDERQPGLARMSDQLAALDAQIDLRKRDGAVLLGLASAFFTVVLLLCVGVLGAVWRLLRGAQALNEQQKRLTREVEEREAVSDALRQANGALQIGMQAMRRRNVEVTLLRDLGRMLDCCRSFDEAKEVIANQMPQLFPGGAGQLFVNRPSGGMLALEASWGEGAVEGDDIETDDCWALRLGQVHWRGADNHPARCRHHMMRSRHETLCVPMTAQGRNLGLLTVWAPQPDRGPWLTEPERQLAQSAVEQISLALANLQLRETLRLQSVSDPLTGLYNRRYLDECMQRELARARRGGHPLGLAMIDIDHFKQYNDRYGHEAGDAVLVALAQCLRQLGRAEDIICRFGGEEFTALLPNVSRDGTLAWAERLMDEVRALQVTWQDSQLGRITISVGLAWHAGGNLSAEALIDHADHALYAAKHAGRDRLCWAADALPG
ncbi:diguanylate cyclase [Chitiniphilus eburneus]|uniref:diguanylate cyclase n=1 Tax=Chitiniphilus eburneus TaxID=2571148 RepID=A0A4U0PYC4_9NEIS|nr:diguanylate cyclase [Chitiniphilus eburneus]TJZ73545.1 diguanylate cyclase [Chitiniphilus eburneus]